MRWGAASEGAQQEPELTVDLLVLQAQNPQNTTLDLRIVVSDASRTELHSVVHQIVRETSCRHRLRVEELDVLRMRHDERVVIRRGLARRSRLEDREVHDPEPCMLPLLVDAESHDGSRPRSGQGRRRDAVVSGGHQHQVAGRHSQRLEGGLVHESGQGARAPILAQLGPQKARCTCGLGAGLDSLHLLPGQTRPSLQKQPTDAPPAFHGGVEYGRVTSAQEVGPVLDLKGVA